MIYRDRSHTFALLFYTTAKTPIVFSCMLLAQILKLRFEFKQEKKGVHPKRSSEQTQHKKKNPERLKITIV